MLGLERCERPNDAGSSRGVTRIIRLAYNGGPPICAAAAPRLRALADARAARRRAPARHHRWRRRRRPSGAERRGRARGLPRARPPHEVLEAPALGAFPRLRAAGRTSRPSSSRTRASCSRERAIAAYARQRHRRRRRAPRPRARPRLGARGRGVVVRTDARRIPCAPARGDRAGRLDGPPRPCAHGLAVPERQVLHVVASRCEPDCFRVGAFPVFILDAPEGPLVRLSRVTASRASSSAGTTTVGEVIDPDAWDRDASWMPRTKPCCATACARYFPGADGPLLTLEDVHLHEHARRALHHRPPTRGAPGHPCVSLLRARLQVRERHGRDRRRPRPRGRHQP